MAVCNRVHLIECKRADSQLFDYYTSLTSSGDRFNRPLQEVLQEARKMFPRKKGFPDFSLVISHRQRIAINQKQNEKRGLQLTGPDGDFYVYEGLLLIGHLMEKKKGILNNAMYRVKAIAQDITVVCELSQKEFALPADFVSAHMRLCFALTYASIQGATLKNRIRLYTHHPRMTLKHLFVGISRATAYALVEVC